MQKVIIFFLIFCGCTFSHISALVLRNETNQTIKISHFVDAQGWVFQNVPGELKPKEIIDIQNVSREAGECKFACLNNFTMVMETNTRTYAFFFHVPIKNLSRMYSGVMGLTFGIPNTTKELKQNYRLLEGKFPGQLNVRIQKVASMKKC